MAENSDTPFDEVTFDTPSVAEPPRIYPLVADDGNQRVLREWLADHDAYALADTDEPLTTAAFDLCIVDQGGMRRYADSIETVKSEAKPALVPVLLLVSELTSDLLETDRGELADNAFATTVDELISLPIRQAELAWRIRALLRLRDQSLELRARAKALRRFQEAVEASGHAIWIGDADGTIEYVNSTFEVTTGYTAEEAVGEHASMLRASVTDDSRDDRVWDAVEAGDTWRGEVTHQRADGERTVIDQTVAPIVDDDSITAVVAVLIDVTDERALEDRLKRHRDIVQRLDDPIMLQDRSGEFVLFNQALTDFAGLPQSELVGADEFAFMDDETAARIDRQKQAVLRTESPAHYSIAPTFEHSDKEAFFSTSRYPYYDENDELAGTIAICRDVTDLEERTRQLRVMDNVLRHNIRNDMNVIRGTAADIRERTTDESAAASTIISHADTLLSTSEKSQAITSVLSEEVASRPIDVAATARSVAADLDDEHPSATITTNAPAEAFVVATDEIQTALTELVTNAIIHHDGSSPAVGIRVADRPAEEAVVVTVTDDGPGMPDFDKEVLVSGRALESLSHGSGLGLWLVYWIVHRASGSITVTDRDPRGTSVTVSLPRADD